MNVLCVVGSPRRNGNSSLLVDAIVQGMGESAAHVTQHFLSDLDINFCRGCGECETAHRCAQRDDMDVLLKDILGADIIVLASPSYWGGVTGQMKTFIDRCLPLCDAKTGLTPVPAGKLGVAVAVRAGKSASENQQIVDTFQHFLGHLGVELAASLTVEGASGATDVSKNLEAIEKAFDLGQHLAARSRHAGMLQAELSR